MANKGLLGAWGEAQAAAHYRAAGYTVVACNYRCRFGEIDLIVKNRKYLAFVEVKLRKSDAFAEAKEFVDAKKQQRLRATAMVWLENHETPLQPRFDVVEIYAENGTATKKPKINRIENAF